MEKISQEILDNLSPDERAEVLKILGEYAKAGSSETLEEMKYAD